MAATACPTVRVYCTFETDLSPEGVVASLIDFSDRRPAIWPNLDPARYGHERRRLGDLVDGEAGLARNRRAAPRRSEE